MQLLTMLHGRDQYTPELARLKKSAMGSGVAPRHVSTAKLTRRWKRRAIVSGPYRDR